MTDEVLEELIEWHDDIAGVSPDASIGSRVVVLGVPAGWGRTGLLDRFENQVQQADRAIVVRLNGRSAPLGGRETAAWLDDEIGGGVLSSLIARSLEIDTAEGAAKQVINVGAAIGAFEIGGPMAMLLATSLTAGMEMRQAFFPTSREQARRSGARIARASVDSPVLVTVDDAEMIDNEVLDAFVGGLLNRTDGRVLCIVAAERNSDIAVDLLAPQRHDMASGHVRLLHVSNAEMTFADRRELCRSLAPDWPHAAIDRLASRTNTLVQVRAVVSLGGSSDVEQSPDPVAKVDELVKFAVHDASSSVLACYLAWCGGALHVEQVGELMRPHGLAPFSGDATDVVAIGDLVRLRAPSELSSLAAELPARVPLDGRRQLAAMVAQKACALIERNELSWTARLATLRPVMVLLDKADVELEATARNVDLCCQLSEILCEVGDIDEALDVLLACRRLVDPSDIPESIVDRLNRLELSLRAFTGRRVGASAAIDRAIDPDRAALVGVEARIWAVSVGSHDPQRRAGLVLHAEGLLDELEALGVDDTTRHWCLQLGAALTRMGAIDLAQRALRPLLSAEDADDQFRVAAELVVNHYTGPHGDTIVAITALENELTATSENDLEGLLRLNAALTGAYMTIGSWRNALARSRDEVRLRCLLQGPTHVDTLGARRLHASLEDESGNIIEARRLLEQLLPEATSVLGPDHNITLLCRSRLGRTLSECGEVDKAQRWLEALVLDEARVHGADHPNTLSTRYELARAALLLDEPHKARRIFEVLVEESLRWYGPDSRDTLTTRHMLARSVLECGEPREARELFEPLVADEARVLGADYVSTLDTRHELARSIYKCGEIEKAREMLDAIVADKTRVLGRDHFNTMTARHDLALWTLRSGATGVAAQLAEELISDKEKLFGAGHPHTFSIRHHHALSLIEGGDFRKGKDLFEKLVEDETRVSGPDDVETFNSRHELARVAFLSGDVDEAIEMFGRLVEDQIRSLGSDHPSTAVAMAWVAFLGNGSGGNGAATDVH